MSVTVSSSSLLLLVKTITHPAARSLCDSWASCLDRIAKWFRAEYNVDVSALKIHLSENAHDALMEFPEFITECRGDTFVKVYNIYYYSYLYWAATPASRKVGWMIITYIRHLAKQLIFK